MTLRRMQGNLGGKSPGIYLPLNLWKIGGTGTSFTVHRSAGGDITAQAAFDGGYLDSNGDLVNPVPSDVIYIFRNFLLQQGVLSPSLTFDYNAGCKPENEIYVAKWDGSATGSFNLIGTGGTQDTSVANQVTMTTGTGIGAPQLILTITNRNDPPRNIRVYQKRYETNVNNGELFNPDLIALISRFDTLRTVDFQGLNNITLCTMTDFSSLADENYWAWGRAYTMTPGTNGGAGPKGLMHPSLLCKLATATGCNLHVHVPIQATDAFITASATYYRDNCPTKVHLELDLELWNFGYAATTYCATQGSAIWPGDGARHNKWAGYRAAQIMKIWGDVYGHRSNNKTRKSGRWHGVLATLNVQALVTTNMLVGVNYYLANVLSPANSLAVNDLFGAVYVTGYIGDGNQAGTKSPASVTKANPGAVNKTAHGLANGATLKFFVSSGMTQLDNQKVTVTVVDADNFTIGVDTTGYSTWVPTSAGVYCFYAPSLLWDMMDQSNTNFVADPVTYPTKYTWFSQQLRTSFLTGTCPSGFNTSGSLVNHLLTYWPPQKAVADANGLELRQYEGTSSQYVGDDNVVHQGSQFNEYMLNCAYDSNRADCYDKMARGFIQSGGINPSRYNLDGGPSEFGTWPALRFLKMGGNGNVDDSGNPVWQAIVNVCDNKIPETYSVRFGA